MTHDELAADLAAHLRTAKRMVWCDIQLGPAGSPRPDVYAIYKSFAAPNPMAYEVKVSRSDFLADTTSGKWRTYLPFACGVFFAVDHALKASREEVPAHCGLMVRGESGAWRAAKRPVLAPVVVPQDALLKLLMDGVKREGPVYRRRSWDRSLEGIQRDLGADVAACVRDLSSARLRVQMAEDRAKDIAQEARRRAEAIRKEAGDAVAAGLLGDLAEALGLARDSNIWRVRDAVREARASLSPGRDSERLGQFAAAIRRALETYQPQEQGSQLETLDPRRGEGSAQ